MRGRIVFFACVFISLILNCRAEDDGDEDFDHHDEISSSQILVLFDINGDMAVSMKEFKIGISEDDDGIDGEAEIERFFQLSDKDADGSLSENELRNAFYEIKSSRKEEDDRDDADVNFEKPKGHSEKQQEIVQPSKIRHAAASRSKTGSTPHPYLLFDIIKQGNFSDLEAKLSYFYSPDASAYEGQCTPLHYALMQMDAYNHRAHLNDASPPKEYERMALFLIQNGADLRHLCEGRTALHLAVQCRSAKAMEAILER
jgi:hypothetical protein